MRGGSRPARPALHRQPGQDRARATPTPPATRSCSAPQRRACRSSRRSAPSDVVDGLGAEAFQAAFAGFPAPFGAGAAPAGISTAGIPGAAPGPGARTHYAFDSSGPGGHRAGGRDRQLARLAGRQRSPPEPARGAAALAGSGARRRPGQGDPGDRDGQPQPQHQLHAEAQRRRATATRWRGPWSTAAPPPTSSTAPKRTARCGSRPAPRRRSPASAPARSATARELSGAVGCEAADSLFGDSGVLLLEVDAAARDPATNVAPVGVRLIPVIEDLSLEATDGTLLRRSRPALFRGLGRRPRGGDRWGQASAGSGNPDPSGGDPYTLLPARPVPGRRLRRPDRARVQLHLLGPRHRRLRPPGPGLDQPAQALPRRRRQGRHRQRLRACSAPSTPARRRSPSAPAASPTPNR